MKQIISNRAKVDLAVYPVWGDARRKGSVFSKSLKSSIGGTGTKTNPLKSSIIPTQREVSFKRSKQKPFWETIKFKSVGGGIEALPKSSARKLKKKLTTSTVFSPIPARQRNAVTSMLGRNQFIKAENPFHSLEQAAAVNILRGVKEGLMPEPPDDRYVKMRSGPFVGKWVKVFEEVPIWTEALYKFVVSSMMTAIAYNPPTRELEIEFGGGAVYRYKNIPPHLWKGLVNAPSKGKYFWKHIRRAVTTYPYKRVRFPRRETKELPKWMQKKGYKT